MDDHPVLEGDQFDDGKSSSGDHDDSMPSIPVCAVRATMMTMVSKVEVSA